MALNDSNNKIILSVELDYGTYSDQLTVLKQKQDALKNSNKELAVEAKKALAANDQATYNQVTKKIVENENAIRANSKEQKNLKNQIDLISQANKAAGGSYEELLRNTRLEEIALKNLEGTLEKNADGSYKLTEAYQKQSAQVEKSKAALINFDQNIHSGTTNVGNYHEEIKKLGYGFGGLSELVGTLGIAFGLDTETFSRFEEIGKGLIKTTKELHHATELNTIEVKSNSKAVEENTVAIETQTELKAETAAITEEQSTANEALTTSTEAQTVAQEELNVAEEANPIGIIIVALLAFGAALYGLNAWMTSSSDETKKLTEENKKLNEEYERNKLIADRKVEVGESEIELMKAQGKPLDEIIAKEKEINEVKEKSLLANIAVIKSNIQLDVSKLNDIKANDSLYESILKDVEATERSIGATQLADATEKLIQINKQERSKEVIEDANKQLDALAKAQASYNTLKADELKEDADNLQTKKDNAQKYIDKKKEEAATLLGLQQDLEDARNNLIVNDQERELAINRTAFQRKIAVITGQSQVEIDLRAALLKEENQKAKEINKKYSDAAIKETERVAKEKAKIDADAITQGLKDKTDSLKAQEIIDETTLSDSKANNAKILQDKLDVIEAERVAKIAAAKGDQAQIDLINAEALKSSKDLTDAKIANDKKFTKSAIDNAAKVANDTINYFKESEKQKTDYEIGALQARLTAGTISQAAFDTQRKNILTKQAKDDKIYALAQAAINTAIAVTAGLSKPAIPPFPTAIAAGIAGALQIALIAKQKIPTFGKGGTFGGNYHSSGGTRGYFEDGTQVEVERDENFYVLNRKASRMINGLSKFNAFHGGVDFAKGENGFMYGDGGLVNVGIPALTQQTDQNVFALQNQAIVIRSATPPPVVTVEAINAGLNSESVRLSRATIGT